QSPNPFPTSNAIQSNFGGGSKDAFATAFNAGGGSVAWSTYLGGGGDDSAAGLVRDLDANLYLVGSTGSTDFPTASRFQASYGGSGDAFVSKLAPLPPPAFTVISNDTGASATDHITSGQSQTLSGTSLANATITLYQAGVGQVGTATANGSGNWTSATL